MEWLAKNLQNESIRFYSFDDFINTRCIGYGGYGIVFKARVKTSGIAVAYKFLDWEHYQDDETMMKDFVKEVGI